MVRSPLTNRDRERGLALGRLLQHARGRRNAAEVALQAGISLDTLRKIERGAIPTPAFFTVAALANVLHLDLATLADDSSTPISARINPSPESAPHLATLGAHLRFAN